MVDEVPSWPQLRARMACPGYRTVVGALRWSDTSGEEPGGPTKGTCRFWYAPEQDRLRVVDEHGVAHVQNETWAYLRAGDGRMIRHEVERNGALQPPFGHPWTLFGNHLDRRDGRFTDDGDFFQATGPAVAVTVAGRRAWEVELAPPPRKPAPLRIAVDDLTGTVLRMVGGAGSQLIELTEFTPHGPIDAVQWVWTGDYEPWEPPPRQGPDPAGMEAGDIERTRYRLAMVSAVATAADRRHEVLDAVAAAPDPEAARAAVSRLLGIAPEHAGAVVDMQFRRLCRSNLARIHEEVAELRELLAEFEG